MGLKETGYENVGWIHLVQDWTCGRLLWTQ